MKRVLDDEILNASPDDGLISLRGMKLLHAVLVASTSMSRSAHLPLK